MTPKCPHTDILSVRGHILSPNRLKRLYGQPDALQRIDWHRKRLWAHCCLTVARAFICLYTSTIKLKNNLSRQYTPYYRLIALFYFVSVLLMHLQVSTRGILYTQIVFYPFPSTGTSSFCFWTAFPYDQCISNLHYALQDGLTPLLHSSHILLIVSCMFPAVCPILHT